jgi:hypothetical protein
MLSLGGNVHAVHGAKATPPGEMEDAEMKTTWGRVLAGGVVALIVLGLAVLEVVSERASTDPIPPVSEPSAGAVDEARGLSGAIQSARLTVLRVDREAHRLVLVKAAGQVRVANIGGQTEVVTADDHAADLAVVTEADLVRIEPANGRIRKIVLLRHGWDGATAPEH